MADSTISQLPAAVSLSATDLIPVDQGGVTKRATLAMLGNGTVIVAPGKILTVNATLTFNGTDGVTITFPATSATMARTDAGQTFAGTQVFGTLTCTTINGGTLSFVAAKTLTVNNTITFTGTDGVTITLPATSATMARTDAAQTFTGLQTFTNGITTPAQVTSTIVTGTAPFVVASTTPVTNLSIGGNAATASVATALQTARTIDGVSFDGTANITIVAPATHAAPNKATPVDVDEFSIWDSVGSVLNHVTWANIKTTLGTTFAALAGSASRVFSVAAATAVAHAVRADQIQDASLTAFTTGGTATAYTLTPTPAITAYTANQTFEVIFNLTCGAAPTLAISGVASPPNLVRQLTDGTYLNLIAGSFPASWQSPVKLVSATQALVLKLPPRTKSVSGTRDLTTATGTQAVTGFGFVPVGATITAMINGALQKNWGNSDGVAQTCIALGYATAVDNNYTDRTIMMRVGAADYQSATVAFSSDTVTISWTKAGSPTGTCTFSILAWE